VGLVVDATLADHDAPIDILVVAGAGDGAGAGRPDGADPGLVASVREVLAAGAVPRGG
jgi:hypothetical protein